MSASQVPEPGWYPNAQGLIQWWNGDSWGPLADPAASPDPSPPAPAAPVAQTALAPRASQPQPAISLLVWASIGCTVLGALCLALIVAVLSTYTGASNITTVTALLQIGGIGLAVAGAVLAIVGLVRSARKRAGVLAIVLAAIVLTSPVWLVLLGWVWWFAAGIFSQLTGGPTVG